MRLFLNSLGIRGVSTPTTKKLFVLRGQSNMNTRWGLSGVPLYLQGAIPNSFIWHSGGWTPVIAGMITNDPGPIGGDFCNLINFAYLMNQAFPNEIFYYDFWAVGGTDLDYWSKPSGTGWVNGLANHNEILTAHPEIVIQAFLWLQGETDGLDTIRANAYELKEQTFVSDMKDDYANSAQWITSNIGDVTAGGLPFADTVRQAKIDNFANNIYEKYFDTFDLPLSGDGQHFYIDEQIIIGQRFFDAHTI